MSDNKTILILHGWGGNKPAHWQEQLAADLATGNGVHVVYPKFPDPTHPILSEWQNTLHATVSALPDAAGVTVLAHSLGAINWLHYAASGKAGSKAVADRVLLVAPPYVIREIPPTDAPEGVGLFFPPPLEESAVKSLARETHFVATDSDDYATFEQTKAYSDRLNLPIHLLAGAGHISPYWGYGNWPWVLEWAMGRADLPPQPNK